MIGPAIGGLIIGLVLATLVFVYRNRRRGEARAGPDPRVAQLSQMAGGLAHELRNPLSTLMVNLQLLAENLRELEDDQQDVGRRSLLKVEAIRHEAERLKHLLDEFLKLAGAVRLDARRVDLNQTVEHLAEFFSPQADAAGVRLHAVWAPEPLECMLDERMIEQALLNVLINAQEAMPDGGEIMIRTRRGQRGTADVEVSDTGPGVPPEAVDRVFQPFYSTKGAGTGLGLSTTQRIITEHGGGIDLHSEPGRGTCFTIHLPLAGGDAPQR
ncbi:MAG TPA: ATP-binding protein [Phycisphaerae bacterium]|nr:ATP-binding protein [Phycisphaerae bacterium]